MGVVLDSCVVVDIFLKNRPRHREALRLRTYLNELGIEIKIPTHAILEIRSAIEQERKGVRSLRALWGGPPAERFVDMHLVPIDEAFIKDYYDVSIRHLKAGDYPFVAIAKRDALPLITEDKKQRAAAIQAGVDVYSILEYLTSVGR